MLCAYFQINPGNSHRALDDAVSAHQLYYKLYAVKPDDEGFRETLPLNYTVKKDTPVTAAQKRYLAALVSYHGLTLEQDIDSLTKAGLLKSLMALFRNMGNCRIKIKVCLIVSAVKVRQVKPLRAGWLLTGQ